jgi:CheY-like chemotaxis protein
VKRLVTLHNGSVTAASDGVGRGSTFTITLPLGTGSPAGGGAPGRAAGAMGGDQGALSIVLIEDNPDIREPMEELLRDLGHDVATASDGGSGAELILRLKPDVAVVDVGLPVMNGYEVAERVRSRLGPDGPRLVAMTGFGQESDRLRARQAGFDAHLVKPADIEAIRRVLSDEASDTPGATAADDASES